MIVCRRINCGGHASPVNFQMIAASLRLILQWTVPAIQARVTTLTDFIASQLESKGPSLGLSVVPANMRCGHIMGIKVDVKVAKISLADLGRKLKEEGILVTLRHSRIRVSPYVHNTLDDMQRVVETLERLITTAQHEQLQARGQKKVVLLIGGSGWLGQQIVHAFRNPIRSTKFSSTYLTDTHDLHVTYLSSRPYFLPASQCHQLDLSSAEQCHDLIAALRPDIVINTAAMSSPVACQKQPEKALAVNCPTQLIEAISTHVPDSLTLFTSTDLIYDGEGAPYSPTHVSDVPPVPSRNVYGATKLKCEHAICGLPRGLVFRLSNMVGGNFIYAMPRNGGMKFLSWVQQSLESHAVVSLKDDEFRSFVLSSDIADLLLSVCVQYDQGLLSASHPCWSQRVYNAGGPQGLSRLDFARIVSAAQGVTLLSGSKNMSTTSPSPPSRNEWSVVAMHSLEMACASGEEVSSLSPERLQELAATLPPRDVTMNSSLTEEHFAIHFSSIESGVDECLQKL